MRPARVALDGDMEIGIPCLAPSDRCRVVERVYVRGRVRVRVGGAMLAAVFERATEVPLLWVVIGGGLTLGFGCRSSSAPASHLLCDLFAISPTGLNVSPPAITAERLPVVQDDDLGALTASFNRMQAGLAERQRLQAAFGLRRPRSGRPVTCAGRRRVHR